MASNHNNRMDFTFQLLSCWLHFRITLPHIYGTSDYFQITTGRGWTITWMEEWCFDTPRICNTVFLNLKLSNIYSAYDSRRSHLQLHSGMIKPSSVPSSEMSLGKSKPQEETRPSRYFVPPWTKSYYTIAWKSTPASTRALEIWADCWKWTLSAGKKGENTSINKQLIASGAFRYWGEKHKKEAPEVLRLSIPFSPRQVSCGKQHCFIEVNVTVLPLMLLFCQ